MSEETCLTGSVELSKIDRKPDNDDAIRIDVETNKDVIQKGQARPVSDIQEINDFTDDNVAKDESVVRSSRRNTKWVMMLPYQQRRAGLGGGRQGDDIGKNTQKQTRNGANFMKRSYIVAVELAEPTGEPLDYDEPENRNQFVFRVFALCTIMLATTFAFVIVTYNSEGTKKFMRSWKGLLIFILAFIGTLVVQYVYCCSNCSRVVPTNYILNVLATICYSYVTSYLSAKYVPYVVMGAAATTLAVTVLCLLLALTSFDFSRFILLIAVAMFALFFSSIFCGVLQKAFDIELSKLNFAILCLSATFCSVMLIVEFQMILGGKTIELGEEDYTFGAYMVYTSVISLFLKFMGILNFISSDD